MSELSPVTALGNDPRQLETLRNLLRELVPGNKFYTPRLHAAGLDQGVESIEQFVTRMPLTTKQELIEDQAANPPFGTTLTYPLDQYTRYHHTSGTTGAPLRWLDTTTSWNAILDGWLQVYRAAEIDANDRVFVASSFGPFIGLWAAFDAAVRLGCLVMPGGAMRSIARLHAILDSGVTVLCTTPTYAIRLGETARENNVDLSQSQVRRIIVGGEPGASVPAVRELIEKPWPKARLLDHHGMTEVGPATYSKPSDPGRLYVIPNTFLVEVLDPKTLAPVEQGRTGELVLTTLRRAASALLRYRTGDLVKWSIDTTDASGAPQIVFEGGILGRVDDMIFVRGVNVYPSVIDQVVWTFDDVAEYRVEIRDDHGMHELAVTVEPVPQCEQPDELCNRLKQAFRDVLHIRVPVTAVAAGELPRFEMKAKRWVKV